MSTLFTKAIMKKLPTLDATADVSIDDSVVICKLFGGGAHTWYITAYDPDTKEAFGFVTIGDPDGAELGYINMTELERLKFRPFGLGVERDRFFEPTPLQTVIDAVRAGKPL